MGMSSLNGYRGIRKAPAAFSLIPREFQPIQDDCHTRTLIKARKAARDDKGPLLEESDALIVAGEPIEATIDEEDAGEGEDGDGEAIEGHEDDDLPDLLLRESARIVGDMIELGSDEPLLARQFSSLSKDQEPKSITESLN